MSEREEDAGKHIRGSSPFKGKDKCLMGLADDLVMKTRLNAYADHSRSRGRPHGLLLNRL